MNFKHLWACAASHFSRHSVLASVLLLCMLPVLAQATNKPAIKPSSTLPKSVKLATHPALATNTLLQQASLCNDISSCIHTVLLNAGQFDLRPSFYAMQRLHQFAMPSAKILIASSEWQKRAQEEQKRGNLAAARDLLQQALVIAPDNEMLYIELGQLFLQTGNLSQAREKFEQAIALVPWRSAAWDGLAQIYQVQGQTELAAASLAVAFEWTLSKTARKTEYVVRKQEASYARALEMINTRNVQVIQAWQQLPANASSMPKLALLQNMRLDCKPPQYPKRALRAEQEGDVTLQFLLETDGSVLDSRIAQSSGTPDLDAAARLALSACFGIAPSEKNQLKQRAASTLQFAWRLDDME